MEHPSKEELSSTAKEVSFDRICQALFETAAEGLAVVDKHGAICLANTRLETMFGYEKGQLNGQKIEVLVPDRHRGTHSAKRDGFVAQPTRRSMGIGMDLSGKRLDGSEFPVEISLNHFDSDGERYIMALVSDITKRKEAEAVLEKMNQLLEDRVQERTNELKESQRLYSIIARNFPNGTINVFDRDFNYVFAEGRELFKLGVTSEQLVGTNYLERLDPSVRETVAQNLAEVFAGGNLTFDIELNQKYFELHAVPLRDPEGQVKQILVVETNVTPQKLAEINVLASLEKERTLNELKSRFVAMASHEFRTPLSTILTSLSLLSRYDAPEHEVQRKKHFGRIKSSVHNLTGILNDFLNLDKLESGIVAPNYEELDLNAFLEETMDELQTIGKPGQTLVLEYEGESSIDCDPNMLRNVLVNLISNAFKYSGEGAPVELKAKVAEGKVQLSVRDHGIGIPEGDKELMFGRFFRAKNAINIQGTGLGLNIVKKYLDLLCGDIWFESELGEGTTFFLVLPQKIQK